MRSFSNANEPGQIKGTKWLNYRVHFFQHYASHTVYCKSDTFLRYEDDNWMPWFLRSSSGICRSAQHRLIQINSSIYSRVMCIRCLFKCLSWSFVSIELNESAAAQALREMSPADSGYSYADQLSQIEDNLLGRDVYVKEGSPFRMYSRFKQASPESRTYMEKAARLIQATKSLKK